MPIAGVAGRIWQPVAEEVEGQDVPFTQNTANYLVAYLDVNEEGGMMRFKADCNTGSMAFVLNAGGMIGGYLAQPGPMTLAFCGEESFDQQFVGALQAAQNYRVRPGGNQMELAMPAGGPTYVFQNIGVEAVAPEPTPLPPVAIETPEPQAPYGVVIAPAGVNVRTGPGSVYPVIGVAEFGTEGAIIGRSPDGLWWVTPVRNAPDGQGWVAVDFVQAFNTENVPVIEAPATPTPIPTLTPVPAATSQPVMQFFASNTVINQGECTTLSWNVENIQAVWVYPLGQPFTNFPVTGQGSQEVCPQQTTTYEMRVLLTDGTVQTQSITIQVITSNPLANTGWVAMSLYGNPTLTEAMPNLFFYDDGRAAAFGGCNNFSGPYYISGSSISIGPLAGSLVACSEAITAQEQVYLNALQSAVSFQVNAGELVLRDGSGQEVGRFSRLG
jgi:heat shock protein HslJ/uncharacterized protein YraI